MPASVESYPEPVAIAFGVVSFRLRQSLCLHILILAIVLISVLLSGWFSSGWSSSAAKLSLPGSATAPARRFSSLDQGFVRAAPIPTTQEAAAQGVDAGLGTAAVTAELPAVEAVWPQVGESVEAEPAPVVAEPVPPFFSYHVQPGDTLTSIAAAFGISPESIVWNNGEIRDPDLLNPGQELLIPSQDGIIHTIRLGETLWEIAQRYDVELADILAANGIVDPDLLPKGLMVLVPGATPPPPPPAPAAAQPAAAVAAAQPAQQETVTAAGESSAAEAASRFIWPFSGSISSPYGEPRAGGSYHTGIDIDGFGRLGAPVVAAAAGKVVFVAEWGYSYGYHIIIDHGDGWETLYAHLSRIDVEVGQYVEQGQVIGGVGSTGYSTGVHLHFEVRRHGKPLNPLEFLP